jgi:hypothetical protein
MSYITHPGRRWGFVHGYERVDLVVCLESLSTQTDHPDPLEQVHRILVPILRWHLRLGRNIGPFKISLFNLIRFGSGARGECWDRDMDVP